VLLFPQQPKVPFKLLHACLAVLRHTADLLRPSCAAAAAILAAVFAASSCFASSSAMAASRLASDSRDATVDAEGLRGLGIDFWGLREILRGPALAQGISWGCRFLGRWPDSQDFAGAGWNLTWPDLVLKPGCRTQCLLVDICLNETRSVTRHQGCARFLRPCTVCKYGHQLVCRATASAACRQTSVHQIHIPAVLNVDEHLISTLCSATCSCTHAQTHRA